MTVKVKVKQSVSFSAAHYQYVYAHIEQKNSVLYVKGQTAQQVKENCFKFCISLNTYQGTRLL
jgi:hypothetical protein